jgi:hypothetical protein
MVKLKSTMLLSPYGDFPHKAAGMQRITRAGTTLMQARALIDRIPVYVGHPDDPAFADSYKDDTAYGYVIRLIREDDGIYAVIRWVSEDAANLAIELGSLSPRWMMQQIDGFRCPVRLVSIGLTSEPNLRH